MINMDTPEAQATRILDKLLYSVVHCEMYSVEALALVAEFCDKESKRDGDDGGPIFAAFAAFAREQMAD